MLNTNNQNSIPTTSMGLQQKLEDRRVFEQFANKNTHVTCDKPKGYLVKENPAQQLGSAFVDTFKDVGNLGKALATGKSNDLELGRMNDVGMKVGGALIAAALMGSKATKNKKLMELVGFGTFFSVMSLWPKVAIDLPTKLIHGFNPHQKYVDSQGRKKLFFQDNQYLPWDVWTKEDINKVADKMNVPKDIKDREEYTKEKMRTIALQGNTLWMLTAGFASPLLTSLVCNRVENAMAVPVAQQNMKKVGEEISKFDDLAKKALEDSKIFGVQDKEFETLIASLKKGEMPENFAERLTRIFDIKSVVDKKGIIPDISPTTAGDVEDIIARLFKETDEFVGFDDVEKAIRAAGGNDADIATAKDLFTETFKRIKGQNQDAEFGWDYLFAQSKRLAKSKKLNIENWSSISIESLPKTKVALGKIDTKEGAKTLEEIYEKVIKPAQAQTRVLGRELTVLSEVSGEKYNLLSKTLLKKLGFSNKEIRELRNTDPAVSSKFANKIVERFAEIAGDDKKKRELISLLLDEEEKLKKTGKITFDGLLEDLKGKAQGGMRRLAVTEETVDGTTKVAKFLLPEKLRGSRLEKLLLSKDVDAGLSDGAFGRSKLSMTSVDAMVSKIFSAFDLESRIKNGEVSKALEDLRVKHGCTESVEELLDICRNISWQRSYGAAMNKLYQEGNGAMFEDLINLVFKTTSPETIKTIKTHDKRMGECVERISKHNEVAKTIILGSDFVPNSALVKDVGEEGSKYLRKLNAEKFAEYGESLISTLKKQTEQLYNNKTWMRTFGGITIGLIGATLISQLFFGKVKDSHLYQQNQQDTFNKSGK